MYTRNTYGSVGSLTSAHIEVVKKVEDLRNNSLQLYLYQPVKTTITYSITRH